MISSVAARASARPVDGVITSKRPNYIDQTFDLRDGFVIPPLAEGHNHWLEPSKIDDAAAFDSTTLPEESIKRIGALLVRNNPRYLASAAK